MKRSYLFSSLIFAAGAAGIYFLFFIGSKAPADLITVSRGSITETVSITGNTTPTQSVSVGFQDAGTIANIYRNLGDKVSAGQIIARLNMSDFSATLLQAKANADTQKAKLAQLEAGTRPEELQVDEVKVANAKTALEDARQNLADKIRESYTRSDDAVRNTSDQFFNSPRSSSPQLSFNPSDAILKSNLENGRANLEGILIGWDVNLKNLSLSADLDSYSSEASSNLTQVKYFIDNAALAVNVLTPNSNLTQTTIDSWKSDVSAARTSINTGLANLSAAREKMRAAQSNLSLEERQLALARAGSAPEEIAAQQAQVEQALAGVASAQSKLQGAEIIAPISGILSQQDAKVGQLASPGAPLISIIGDSGFEVDAGVSETDVGKLTLGNAVAMTLDAFSNETFSGSVFYIAPAQTNNQGVITYQIKISFNKPDPRIKSGLTANIKIQTRRKDDALILPQYAILQNDQGTFVEVVENKAIRQIPVVIGIQDENGNVEILSGVSEGGQVLNIGLKKQ